MRSMIKIMGIMLIGVSALSNSYAAEGDTYMGVQYSMVTYSETGFPDFEPVALIGRYGSFTSDNFAIEGRFGIGLADDTQNIGSGFDGVIEIDSMFGVYGVGYADTGSTRVYGLFGFTQGKLTATIPGFGSVSESDSDISFGFGVDIDMGGNAAINLEYMNYMEFEGSADITAIAIGYKASF